MILLDPVVQLGGAAIRDRFTQRLVDRPWIGVMPVGGDPLGWLPSDIKGYREEAFGRIHIALLAEQRVAEVAITIDSAVEVLSHSTNLKVCFVGMPGTASPAPPFGT